MMNNKIPNTNRRKFLKTSAKVSGVIGISSLSGFGILGLSACDSKQGVQDTQSTQKLQSADSKTKGGVMQKIVVIGGSGYIGTFLIPA